MRRVPIAWGRDGTPRRYGWYTEERLALAAAGGADSPSDGYYSDGGRPDGDPSDGYYSDGGRRKVQSYSHHSSTVGRG